MQATLIRIMTGNDGVISEFSIDDGAFKCFALAPDSLDEKKFFLPNGEYECRRFHGSKWPNTFEIVEPEKDNVDGHKYLLFHAGNTEHDSLGCQLLGSTIGKLNGDRAVLNSGNTFRTFFKYTENVDHFTLTVTEDYGVLT